MALINCGECDRMASDQAAACPHCGAPVAKQSALCQVQHSVQAVRRVGFWLGVGIFLFPIIFVWFLLRQGHAYQLGLHRAWRCCKNTHVQGLRTSQLTDPKKTARHCFTHALPVDKVTDIASWQAVVSHGWSIYSVFCEQERCRFNPRTPHPPPTEFSASRS